MNRRTLLTAAAAAPFLRGQNKPAPPSGLPFQLGCVTYNLLKDLSLDECIKVLESSGLAAIELRTGHKHGIEPSISAAERVRVRERFAKSKVRLLSYGTTCEFHSPDAAVRRTNVESGKAFVDLAVATGALAVKVRPNGLPTEVDYRTTIANISTALRELGEYGQQKGVEIWLEIHGPKTAVPRVSADILEAVHHPNVGACWNSNPQDVVEGSVKQSFALLQPFIRNLHINELASPEYPWRELFGLLRKSGYMRYMLAEVGASSPEPERFLKYYKALWTELASERV